MARTFKDTLESDLAIFQNVNELGVAVTYYPKDGEPRSFNTQVEKNYLPSQQGGIDTTATLLVFAKKTVLQIDNPQVGDRFREDTDPEEEFYSLSDEHAEDEDEFSWWLIFRKKVNVRTGGNTR